MAKIPQGGGAEPNAGPSTLGQRKVDSSTIVFAVKNHEAVKDAAEKQGNATSDALAAVLKYVKSHRGSTLRHLDTGTQGDIAQGERWSLAGPSLKGKKPRSTIHVLRLDKPTDAPALLKQLQADKSIEFAHSPVVQSAAVTGFSARVRSFTGGPLDLQWYRSRCGFGNAGQFDPDGAVPRLAIIDTGPPTSFALAGRVTMHEMVTTTAPSRAAHAGAVAGVIAANSVITDAGQYVGCCDAPIDSYNVFTDDAEFDAVAFYDALADVVKTKPAVLNLSMGGPDGGRDDDLSIKHLLKDCHDAGVVVVAAIGDSASETALFPASDDNVIAVGSTDFQDRRVSASNFGPRLAICAPGVDIYAPLGDDEFYSQEGTSFSCAMVSAAIWLARRADPKLTPSKIKDLLPFAVAGATLKKGAKRTDDLGFGRLDVGNLMAKIQND